MLRRSFMLWARRRAAAAGSGHRRVSALAGNHADVLYPAARKATICATARTPAAASETIHTDVAIFGSGIAGLTAAWKLNKLGTGIC
jgi:heterodisulfide reductase subunit A-like polyferredoxin